MQIKPNLLTDITHMRKKISIYLFLAADYHVLLLYMKRKCVGIHQGHGIKNKSTPRSLLFGEGNVP